MGLGIFRNVFAVSYRVKDWEKAKQFYSQVLGLPVYYSDDAFGWAEYGGTNETRVAIERVDTTELRTEQGGGLAIFSVDDARQVTEELRARGVRCDDVISVPGSVTYGSFYDPEGNRFQFVQYPAST